MKQLEHGNILPFYGVSTAIADFCLVFPWCENGSIMEYLKRNPDNNRFTMVSMLEEALSSQTSLAPMNSYPVWPEDCASCTKTVWFTAP